MRYPTEVLIFPGLDGTKLLLGEFSKQVLDSFKPRICPLPDRELSYPELCDHFSNLIEEGRQYIVVAESFSGPLGILLAHRFPDQINRLILVASFACAPRRIGSRLFNFVNNYLNQSGVLFKIGLPKFVARRFFLGNASPDLIKSLQVAVKTQRPSTLRYRISQIANVDVRRELSELRCLVHYVQPQADRLVPKTSLTEILKTKPDTRVHEILGPHLIMQTQPQSVWIALDLS